MHVSQQVKDLIEEMDPDPEAFQFLPLELTDDFTKEWFGQPHYLLYVRRILDALIVEKSALKLGPNPIMPTKPDGSPNIMLNSTVPGFLKGLVLDSNVIGNKHLWRIKCPQNTTIQSKIWLSEEFVKACKKRKFNRFSAHMTLAELDEREVG